MSADALLLKVPADEVFVEQRGLATVVKDPQASRFYGWDLSAWLVDDDRIASATVELNGIDAVEPDTNGDPVVHLSGDSAGYTAIAVELEGGSTDFAEAKCLFTTTGGFMDVRRIRFLIRER